MSSSLVDLFTESFPSQKPTAIVHAPGRVNLIGEHTDYNGYPVLPMALRREIRFILGPRTDERVCVRSSVADLGQRSFELSPEIDPFENGDWGNYVKAATQGLVGHFGDDVTWRGYDAIVHGDVPHGAGLSSSSALVVASACALLAANDRDRRRTGRSHGGLRAICGHGGRRDGSVGVSAGCRGTRAQDRLLPPSHPCGTDA